MTWWSLVIFLGRFESYGDSEGSDSLLYDFLGYQQDGEWYVFDDWFLFVGVNAGYIRYMSDVYQDSFYLPLFYYKTNATDACSVLYFLWCCESDELGMARLDSIFFLLILHCLSSILVWLLVLWLLLLCLLLLFVASARRELRRTRPPRLYAFSVLY